MDGIAQEWLEEHRRRKDSGEANGNQDLMDVMLSILAGTDPTGYDADTINKATSLVCTLFLEHLYMLLKKMTFFLSHNFMLYPL